MAAVVIALLAGGGLLGRQVEVAQVVASAPMENRTGRGDAVVLVRRNGEGVVQLHGVGDLTDGRVYQAWVIPPGSAPVATGRYRRRWFAHPRWRHPRYDDRRDVGARPRPPEPTVAANLLVSKVAA